MDIEGLGKLVALFVIFVAVRFYSKKSNEEE
jgi:hypothetical protein